MTDKPLAIFAVDPGLTTGWAVLLEPMHFACGEAGESHFPFLADRWLSEAVGEYGEENILVVCERFIINAGTAKKTQAPWSLEQIGALRYLCRLHRVELVLQSPGEAKSFSTNDKLKTLGWYAPSTGGHQADAARHLLLAAARLRVIDPRVFLKEA